MKHSSGGNVASAAIDSAGCVGTGLPGEASSKVSLVTSGVIVAARENAAQFDEYSEYRWWLLKQAKQALPDVKPLQHCMTSPVKGTPVITVVRNPNTSTAHFRYVQHCDRPWLCPECMQRITAERRSDMQDDLARAMLKGRHAVMATFTLRHTRRDRLKSLLDGLNRARRRMLQHRSWRLLKDEYDIKGQIRSLEITWGENGWHPHLHVLLFLARELSDAQIDGLKQWLYDIWSQVLELEGFDASFEHGVHVRHGDSEAAEYIAKWGHDPLEDNWGVVHEMANAPAKKAHGDGLTYLQLLAASATNRRALALVREYAEATKGCHLLEYSQGLRSELKEVLLPVDNSNPQPLPSYNIVEMPSGENYVKVCKLNLQPQIRKLAGVGLVDELRLLFAEHGIIAVVHDPPISGNVATSPAAGEAADCAAGRAQLAAEPLEPQALPADGYAIRTL